MTNLFTIIKSAEKDKIAIGHFNISNLEMLKAISRAAVKTKVPVIIGVSEGERGYVGVHHVRDLIESYRKEHGEKDGLMIYLNADHTHSLEKCEEAARLGFDAILFDGGKLDFEENIKQTKKVVEVVKSINSEILVEGEIGYIGSSSKILDEIPEGAAIKPEDLTKPEEAARFVKETGVDLLAPAVGNIHGMLVPSGVEGFVPMNPDLNIDRIKEIREAAGIPLVLHGGSGIKDADFLAAIDAGVSIVHISTELRKAWREALDMSLRNNPDEISPYKIMPPVIEAIEGVVEKKLKLFNKIKI